MVIKDYADWTTTVIRAADLIKIADQIRNDQKKICECRYPWWL